MKKCLVLLGVAALAVLLTTSAVAGNRGVSFTSIGFIDPPGQFPASSVWEMNPAGTVFVTSPSFSGSYITLWTRETGWQTLVGSGTPSSAPLTDAGTLMSNGIYPGSNPAYLWPGLWLGATDMWSPLPSQPGYAPCGTSRMSFYDQGGEGDFAAGLTWQGCAIARAFKWDKATNTTVDLGSPNTRSTRGNAITADGSEVIGWGTMLQGLRRGAAFKNGTVQFLGDPSGLEPKSCSNGKGCTSNSADPVFGCPDYVDDGSCPTASKGTCTGGVCVGGFDAGKTCTNSSQCGGTCAGGPNNGLRCTSNSSCPDTPVCLNNPNWTDDLFKGEAYDCTPDGGYAVGRSFDYGMKWTSGYRMNPDGSFSEMMPVVGYEDRLIDPFAISNNGKVAVGMAGTRLTGTFPFFWSEATGTVDFQLFLVAQGLDELYFWYLAQNNAVSADGMIIGGFGYNPDGLMEGYIVDMHKVWVCHMPPGNPENARTLGVEFDSVGDHLAHGDFLGTCEFMNSGGLSRATAQLRERRAASAPTSEQLLRERNATLPADWNTMTASRTGVAAKQTPGESRERSTAPAKERRKKHLVSE
jgi:uncharacterized membrane protein